MYNKGFPGGEVRKKEGKEKKRKEKEKKELYLMLYLLEGFDVSQHFSIIWCAQTSL
jgi:hypothetical protein